MEERRISKKVRALGLTSGGLDSILSALVLREQGIDVTWVSFTTPFFSSHAAQNAADRYKIPLMVVDITDIYLEMLKNPPAGYGKNMNPCMDCHTLMFSEAGRIMVQEGFDFLFSGEVAGQRPFSQNKRSLRYVEKHSGFDGSILRPLSAGVLPETAAERQKLVDRNRLGSISGRSRKKQIEMAKQFNVVDYPAPAGGCRLTDKAFSVRLKDLFDLVPDFEKRDLYLLNHGRHLRLDSGTRIVVGRSEADNGMIETFYVSETDTFMRMVDLPGPLVLIPQAVSSEMEKRSAAICAGYTKAKAGQEVKVLVRSPAGERVIQVKPLDPASFQDNLI